MQRNFELQYFVIDFREFKKIFKSVMKTGYDSEIKLSSDGLVYCYFGKKVIKQLVSELNDDYSEKLFFKMYEIDGIKLEN